jgi:small-conductance mechanosensitive channel
VENFSGVLQELLTRFMLFLPKMVVSLVVFIAALVVAGVLGRAIRRTMERRKAKTELTLLVSNITRWTIIVLGCVMALQQVDFEVTAFLTGLGVLGFTVGFALQGVSQNFVAGILLLLQQPFDIGDRIRIGDFVGDVEIIDLGATKLRTSDSRTIVLPNAMVLTSPVVRINDGNLYCMEVVGGVSYDSDLGFVEQTAISAVSEIESVVQDPAPCVVFNNLGSSTVDFIVYYWFDTGKSGPAAARDAGVRAIKVAFEKAKIEMPFPTQVVHLHQ